MLSECIVHLDGMDKVGKSTIKNELVKISNGKILVIDRSFISQIAYSRIYNRNIDENFFFSKTIEAYKRGERFVYLYCEKNDIEERFRYYLEDDLEEEEIDFHLGNFNHVINELDSKDIKILRINTSIFSEYSAVSLICDTYL